MLPSFTYHRPASLMEARDLLQRLGEGAVPLAGGTDLVVDLRRGARRAAHVVSLGALNELRGIRIAGGVLRLGALTTPAELAVSEVVRGARPELLDAVRVFGSPQVRGRATLGGNLCTATPCGDLPPILIALGARVVLDGPEGRRELRLQEFFTDARATRLRPAEILVEVVVPARRGGEGAAYEAFGLRAANYITTAGVAAAVQLDDGVCREARIVLAAVAPTPLLVPGAGARLAGSRLEEPVLRQAAAAARDAARPISDVRGSAECRRELVEALTVRALRAAGERAR